MKAIILFFLFCSFSIICFGENKDDYKASNGITYHIGDTIKLGRGSATNGDFRFLQMGGWAAVAGYNSNAGSSQFNIGKSYSGLNVILRKIKEQRFKGATKITFVVGGGNITNYNLMIEDAIATCEIADCIEKVQKVEIINQSSRLDELKKLKELLDAGAITKDEYEVEKRKLLDAKN